MAIEHALLLERRECIGGQHFGPFIAVVPGGVTTREYVPEVVREAIPLGNREHAYRRAYLAEYLIDARPERRVVFGVQAKIEQREFELAHARESRLEGARSEQLLLLFRRQRCAGFIVPRHGSEHFRTPGEV